MRKLRLAIPLCALAALVLPAQSGAILVGVGEQTPSNFDSTYWGALGVKQTRLITPWNSIKTEPERLDAWMVAARAHGLEPLIAFERARDQSNCPKRPCKAPGVGTYIKAFRAFRKKYPYVKNFQPWNEANSSTQPVGRKPGLAANYYNAMKKNCNGCRIVALDVLDSSNIIKYVRAFKRRVKGPEPLLWGLHNYTDTNRQRTSGTENLLSVTNGEVWLTETGGIVRFETQNGRVPLKYDELRAAKAMKQMYAIAERFRDRITRIYTYQFQINFTGDRFDAGLVNGDGLPRPSFSVFKNGKAGAERIPFPKGVNDVTTEKKGPGKNKKKPGGQKHKCIPSPLGGCQG